MFLRQEGHLSADDLFEHVRREDAGIGRATVYRTLQWMVGAGIARKVDFGEGRSRFEASFRHPRHFHLVCTTCHRSSEFLSSDVEALMEEIAAARNFAPTQSVVQIVGTCEECRTGRESPAIDGTTTDRVFARDALRMAIATERSGLEFYTRAASLTKDRRGRAVFQKLAAEEREHLGTLQRRYAVLAASDPQLESRPTFLFFKGAARPLRRGAKTHRGERSAGAAHRHPVRARIAGVLRATANAEDSGKQVFLEFADERAHRAAGARCPYCANAAASTTAPHVRTGRPPGDRYLHTRDGVRRPMHASGLWRARRLPRHGARRDRPRHGGRW